MSRGIAAARHLFGCHCCEIGRRLATELTRAEADLRTAARKAVHHPDRQSLRDGVDDAKAHRADIRERAAEHEAECGIDMPHCPHEPVCGSEQECAETSCDLCRDGEPCHEHRMQARESAARDAAERNRP